MPYTFIATNTSTNYLQWTLEDFTENSDLYDPYGMWKIVGDEGEIQEIETYLDTFHQCLVQGLELMNTQSVITVDLIDEPYDFIFSFQSDFLEIEYAKGKTLIYDKFSFIEEIKESITRLLTLLDKFADESNQPRREITLLRNFVK